MKTILFLLAVLVAPALGAQPVQSGVLRWSGGAAQMVNGSTTDLASFRIHTSTLEPGKTNHPMQAYNDAEELLVVKEGTLTVRTGDSVRTIGPGGLALVVAGDQQSFRNASAGAVTYYVITYKSKNTVSIGRGREGGGSFVRDWKDFVVRKTDKGESRPVFDRPSSMFERFDVHATSLDPGIASHDPHHHRAEEIILMLKGDVQMQIGQSFYKAAAGDVVFLASDVLHNLTNTGSERCAYFAIQWHNRKED